MIQEIFSVYDAAAARFIDPFVAPTIEMALRGFREVCTHEGHQFQKFPEDYNLFHIGHFDAEKGEVQHIVAVKIAMAMDYRGSPTLAKVDAEDLKDA